MAFTNICNLIKKGGGAEFTVLHNSSSYQSGASSYTITAQDKANYSAFLVVKTTGSIPSGFIRLVDFNMFSGTDGIYYAKSSDVEKDEVISSTAGYYACVVVLGIK